MNEKEANKLHGHGGGWNTIAGARNFDVWKQTMTRFLTCATKQAETSPDYVCFQVFQFHRWKIYIFLYQALENFRLQFLQFFLFMLSNPPVHLYAARLPVVRMLMITSCLQVTIKQEATFHLRHFGAGHTLHGKKEDTLTSQETINAIRLASEGS